MSFSCYGVSAAHDDSAKTPQNSRRDWFQLIVMMEAAETGTGGDAMSGA
jgi:hypothetical protein